MSAFVHNALVYGSPGEFVNSVVPFIREGLELDEHVMVVTNVENQSLLDHALDARSEYQKADSTEWYSTPVRTIDSYRRVLQAAVGAGKPRLRVVGEIEFGSSEIEQAEWRRYESVSNVVYAGHPVWVVCPYDSRKLSPQVVEEAVRTHPFEMRGNLRLESEGFVDPIEMAGPLPLPIGGRFLGELEVGDSLAAVREFVTETGQRAGLSTARTEDMCLVINEIATNSLRYGAPPVNVEAWLDDGAVIYDVSDTGPGPESPFAGFIPPNVGEGDGMGLWLSRLLSDRLEITSGPEGTSIRALATVQATPI